MDKIKTKIDKDEFVDVFIDSILHRFEHCKDFEENEEMTRYFVKRCIHDHIDMLDLVDVIDITV